MHYSGPMPAGRGGGRVALAGRAHYQRACSSLTQDGRLKLCVRVSCCIQVNGHGG